MTRILGYDFGGTKVDIAIGQGDGTLIEETRLWVRDFRGVNELTTAALSVGKTWAARYHAHLIGVSTMGITFEDHVALAPNVPGWSELRLPQLFRDAFPGSTVRIENDVRAACLAEMIWGSLKDVRDAAYLNLGTGIAMAFVLNGSVYAGVHRAAGEIAYLWRKNEPGFAAGRAPFEEQYGGGGMDRTIRKTLAPLSNLKDAFEHLDESAVQNYVQEAFREIARRVGHILLALDLQSVSVGGGIARHFDIIAPILAGEWETHLPCPPMLVASRFVERAGLYGALALAWVGAEL